MYRAKDSCSRLIGVVGGAGGIFLACFQALICEAAGEGITHETVWLLFSSLAAYLI
jgi:hypothetical protein